MNQKDIQVGRVYELARNRGRNGITLLGVKVRAVEKNVMVPYQKQVGIRMILLNEDGTERLRDGKAIYKIVSGREVVSLEEASLLRTAHEQQEAENLRKHMLARKLQTEIEELIISALGFDGADVQTFYDSGTGAAKLLSVGFRNPRNFAGVDDATKPNLADMFVAVLRKIQEG